MITGRLIISRSTVEKFISENLTGQEERTKDTDIAQLDYAAQRAMNQEDIIVLSVNTPINITSKYIKQKVRGLKGEIKFTISFFVIDRTGRKMYQ